MNGNSLPVPMEISSQSASRSDSPSWRSNNPSKFALKIFFWGRRNKVVIVPVIELKSFWANLDTIDPIIMVDIISINEFNKLANAF